MLLPILIILFSLLAVLPIYKIENSMSSRQFILRLVLMSIGIFGALTATLLWIRAARIVL